LITATRSGREISGIAVYRGRAAGRVSKRDPARLRDNIGSVTDDQETRGTSTSFPRSVFGISELFFPKSRRYNCSFWKESWLFRSNLLRRLEKHFHEGSAELQIPRFAPPDFLWNSVALTDFMRLSLRERRTRDLVQCSVAGNPGRDDKKERVAVKKGPLPRDRALKFQFCVAHKIGGGHVLRAEGFSYLRQLS
jgi:hypothetical protein